MDPGAGKTISEPDRRRETIIELRPRLLASGKLYDRAIDAFLAHCADPGWWTQTIAFTAVDGRTPTAE
jgi:hypothetical protein